MTEIVTVLCAAFALLCVASPAYSGVCTRSVARVQAQIDAAIEAQAGSQPWQPESLSALRGHQPTPRTLATADGSPELLRALGSLDRARAADRAGDRARCTTELGNTKATLRQHSRKRSMRSGG